MFTIVNFAKGRAALASGCLLLMAATAGGQTFSSGTGLGIPIPDNGYDGTLGSMASHAITVPAGAGEVVEATVTVGITHTFVGTLVIKLKSPAGTVVTLLHYPGLAGVADDASPGGGNDPNLSATFTILLSDTATGGVSAEQMGDTLDDDDVVGDPANGSPRNYVPGAGDLGTSAGASLPDRFSALDGQDGPGDWTLYVGDGLAADTGWLQSWELTLGPDNDRDRIGNAADNCPNHFNPNQEDTDGDGDGDVCDNCPNTANADQADGDRDGTGDVCDNCPDTANPGQQDRNSDDVGDACQGSSSLTDTPPACCGAAGPLTPLGLAVGMLVLGRRRPYRKPFRPDQNTSQDI